MCIGMPKNPIRRRFLALQYGSVWLKEKEATLIMELFFSLSIVTMVYCSFIAIGD